MNFFHLLLILAQITALRMSKWDHVDCAWAPNVAEELVGPRGYGKCAILVKRPGKHITNDCFEIVNRPVPETLEQGEVLVQQLMLSMDPTHAMWMRKIVQYSPCVALGNVMRCSGEISYRCDGTRSSSDLIILHTGVGRIVKTTDESRLPVGSYVTTFAGLSEYLIMPIEKCPLAAEGVPLSWNLGPLFFGMGHTAWIGNKICAIKPGNTYVVSGAGGAVGSLAGQLAKLAGARVIGIAGGPDKCKMLVEELGFDGTVDYKANNVEADLRALCPAGIDCYFDNVGGDILDIVLAQMNCFGRIAFCGAISTYSGDQEEDTSAGPRNYKLIFMRRLKVQGFLCRDHAASKAESAAEIMEAIQAGMIKHKEDIREVPIDKYVDTLNLLFTGGNTGKLIMKIAD